MAQNLTGATESTGRAVRWNYDGINRLTSETITGGSTNGGVSYSLDPVGNRLSASSSLSGVSSGSWGFNADDEVSSESYDQNGNVTSTGGKTFSYDAENHLVAMNGGAVTLVYDAFGNRVAKTVSGMTTRYLVEDDVNPTGYPQVFDELTNGVVTRTYTYGLQMISQEQLVSSTWTLSFYGYDGGGNVRQLTNATGAVTDRYEYDAFGNAVSISGSTPNNYLYRGEQFDSDLGLYYLRARYYNPTTGRFMSRDPKNGKIKIPATMHKYLYVSGDPVNRIDPLGREDLIEFGGELTDKLSLYNNFSGPNDFAACLDNLITSLAIGINDAVLAVSNDEGHITKKAGDCELELLWGFFNPIPTHDPIYPWKHQE